MPIAASKAVFAVLAVGAGSVLGYNWMTTGCPSGTCPTERAAANIIPAAMTSETEASSCSIDKADSCCPLTEAAAMTAVANELPACCAELDKAACGDASLCTDMPAPEQAQAVIQSVSVETETQQTECEDKADSCCPLTEAAEQTASNAP